MEKPKVHIITSEYGGAHFTVEAVYMDEEKAERRYIAMTGAESLEEAIEMNDEEANNGDGNTYRLFEVDIEDFTPLPLFDFSLQKKYEALLEYVKDMEAERE